MPTNTNHRAVALALGAVLLGACSSTSSDPSLPPGTDAGGPTVIDASGARAPLEPDSGTLADAAPGAYSVEYVAPLAGLHVGRSQFQLKIAAKSDGKPATGLAPSLSLRPLMTMSMMSHGAPVPSDAVKESATPGTYDCTLFFPMASVDASGKPAGQWSFNVLAAGVDLGSIAVPVSPAAGPDTTHVMLKNMGDKIQGSGGAAMARSYPLFRDTVELGGDGRATVKVFVATIQEGHMVWPPVKVGLDLVDASGKVQLSIQSLALEASSDGTTWTPMTCDATSRCGAALPGLVKGTTAKVYVKMVINGLAYTTDGMPPDDGKNNGFATFSVTP